MIVCLTVVGSMVALAAAVRSTWSPCGLSMLSTITPLSERAKGHSYRSTATWFVVGGVAGGATLGAVMALLAFAVGSFRPSPAVIGAIAVGAALVAAASDAGIGGMRLPIHRRQVNERWLDQYRPWVYGSGFGWQIGTGVATYITTAAVYLMVVLGALTTLPVVALAVGTGFGLVRGLAVLLTRHLTDPAGLRAFHRRFEQVGPVVGRAVIAVELASAVALAASLRTPAVVAVAAGLVFLGAVTATAITRNRAHGPGTATTIAADGPVTPPA